MMQANIFVICLICLMVSAKEIFENNSTIGYDPGELLSRIFGNTTQPRASHGPIKFENQLEMNHISFDDQNKTPPTKPFKFEVDQQPTNLDTHPDDYGDNNIRFHIGDITDSIGHSQNGHTAIEYGDPSLGADGTDSIGNEQSHPTNAHKKRRRRKPKRIPGPPGYPVYPGPRPFPGVAGFGPNQPNNGQFYRPSRRRPSIASDALSAVTGALTSIAENDDYQCVARLLCEAAAGGALGGSSLLETVSGLQPLLTLLSAYNGISSNPLFVFGRAAFLGMSSKNSPGSCRYAYPLCPTDPEQLVHYLNNHNGGFFRFFNAPQQGQQNLEQFYNQLSQNYGFYKPNPGPDGHYGLLNPGQIPNYGHQNLYPNGYQQNYEQPHLNPNLYPNGYQQNYGLAYPYNQNYGNGVRFKTNKEVDDQENYGNGNKIEKRIQNKPASFLNDNSDEQSSKWLFPGEDYDDNNESNISVKYVNYDDFKTSGRKGKSLRFPDTYSTYDENENYKKLEKEYNRKPKAISFPERLSNDYTDINNHVNVNSYNDYANSNKYTSSNSYANSNNYANSNSYINSNSYTNSNNYANSNNNYIPNPSYNSNSNNIVFNNFKRRMRYNYNENNDYNHNDEPGVTTVYVVRGNGDPSKPEIVKLRPGETL